MDERCLCNSTLMESFPIRDGGDEIGKFTKSMMISKFNKVIVIEKIHQIDYLSMKTKLEFYSA